MKKFLIISLIVIAALAIIGFVIKWNIKRNAEIDSGDPVLVSSQLTKGHDLESESERLDIATEMSANTNTSSIVG